MGYSTPSRSLLLGAVASALVLTGAAGCSRPDQSESGTNTAAIGQDTSTMTTGTAATDSLAVSDTIAAAGTITDTSVAAGDTAPARIQSNAPRAATATPSVETGDTFNQADTAATPSGVIGQDTAAVRTESDSARVTEDTSEMSQQSGDTAAGYVEMARDTSSTADQVDTTTSTEMAGAATDTVSTEIAVAEDTALQAADTVVAGYTDTTGVNTEAGVTADVAAADTSDNAGRIRPPEDSTEILGQVTGDTAADANVSANADVAVGAETQDTTDNAGRIRPPEDSTELLGQDEVTADAGVSADADVAMGADTLDTRDNAGRVRPPEDSTEILGEVTTDTTSTVAAADTISDRVRPPEDSTEMRGNADYAETSDEEPVDAAEQEISEEDPDVAGAAAIESNVTGSEAVALMTRQGARCTVVDPESEEEVRWDMSSTPVTLNPCGLGSMVLSRIWVVE